MPCFYRLNHIWLNKTLPYALSLDIGILQLCVYFLNNNMNANGKHSSISEQVIQKNRHKFQIKTHKSKQK